MISKVNLVWINILNTIFFVVCIFFNYITVTGNLNKVSHKAESNKYFNYFVPAGFFHYYLIIKKNIKLIFLKLDIVF